MEAQIGKLQILAVPVGRVLIALMFVISGLTKAFSYGGTAAFMESAGVPGVLLPLVILTEFVGGLAVIVGYKTRTAAFLLAGFSALSALFFHADFGDQTQMTTFMKNFAIAGGFLFLVAFGAGAYSIDNRKPA